MPLSERERAELAKKINQQRRSMWKGQVSKERQTKKKRKEEKRPSEPQEKHEKIEQAPEPYYQAAEKEREKEELAEKIKQQRRTRQKWRMTLITAIIILAGGAVTLAWMNTGFVECSGYLEPDSWHPLYAYSEGLVKKGSLEDGMTVIKGSRLILLDDEWPGWNVKRVIQELKTVRCEITYMESTYFC